jgi:hypothetical protein
VCIYSVPGSVPPRIFSDFLNYLQNQVPVTITDENLELLEDFSYHMQLERLAAECDDFRRVNALNGARQRPVRSEAAWQTLETGMTASHQGGGRKGGSKDQGGRRDGGNRKKSNGGSHQKGGRRGGGKD